MADWDEIKRLAADFQRAQLCETVQRLAERNCIEIVQKLQQLSLINVIYTLDGKEYLTHQELTKEIREELQVHGGRINLVDLQDILQVDFKHIETRAQDIVSNDKDLSLILGQIIDRNYLDTIAEEINDKLQLQGQTTIAELTTIYDLPGNFLLAAVKERLGSIIEGQIESQDENTLYTQNFMARQKSKICGAFSAITRPTSVMKIMTNFCLQERLFFSTLEKLINTNRLSGNLSGGRQDTAQYIPDIYTRAQNDWVDSFYKQNGYLEYTALSRLGITDPKGYIKKRWKGQKLMHLSTCVAGPAIIDHVQAEVDEALNMCSWLDIQPFLPSMFTDSDASQLLTAAVKNKSGAGVFCNTMVTSEDFVSGLLKNFETKMQSKATQEAKTNPLLLSKKTTLHVTGIDDGSAGREDKKDQRRKKAAGGGKGGGGGGAGSQGREVKTKSTKKKGGRHNDVEEGDGREDAQSMQQKRGEVDFLSVTEIAEDLKKVESLAECSEEFLEEIALQLHRPLSIQYMEKIKSVFLHQSGADTGSGRRKTHTDLAEKVAGLWSNAKLFEKGIKLFSDDVQTHLSRQLLRTVSTDITNLVFNAVASEHMMSLDENDNMTQEMRLRLLGKIEDEKTKTVLTKLHTSLSGKSLDEFFNHLDAACSSNILGIMLKKPDKKKERQLVFNHRLSLTEQLQTVEEPALGLHLAATLLFTVHTQYMLHAPGRCVPQILQFLKDYLPSEQHVILLDCQDLVMQHMKLSTEKSTNNDNQAELIEELVKKQTELLSQVKDIALNSRKNATGTSQTSED